MRNTDKSSECSQAQLHPLCFPMRYQLWNSHELEENQHSEELNKRYCRQFISLNQASFWSELPTFNYDNNNESAKIKTKLHMKPELTMKNGWSWFKPDKESEIPSGTKYVEEFERSPEKLL